MQTSLSEFSKALQLYCTDLSVPTRIFNEANCGMTFQQLLEVIPENELFLLKGQLPESVTEVCIKNHVWDGDVI